VGGQFLGQSQIDRGGGSGVGVGSVGEAGGGWNFDDECVKRSDFESGALGLTSLSVMSGEVKEQ
jgi:hypothetical protein